MSDESAVKTVKVFIIDDSIVMRQMLARFLKGEEDIEVVGEAGTGQGGIIMLGELYPDVVMLEAAVGGGMSLSDILTEIHNITPDAKIILCTDHSHIEQLPELTNNGHYDFVHKPYNKHDVLRTVRNAARV
jgi:NarL family two-component system response regulator LiaR